MAGVTLFEPGCNLVLKIGHAGDTAVQALAGKDKVALGFAEGFNNKIRVIQRRTFGLRDEEYLALKIRTLGLPEL